MRGSKRFWGGVGGDRGAGGAAASCGGSSSSLDSSVEKRVNGDAAPKERATDTVFGEAKGENAWVKAAAERIRNTALAKFIFYVCFNVQG